MSSWEHVVSIWPVPRLRFPVHCWQGLFVTIFVLHFRCLYRDGLPRHAKAHGHFTLHEIWGPAYLPTVLPTGHGTKGNYPIALPLDTPPCSWGLRHRAWTVSLTLKIEEGKRRHWPLYRAHCVPWGLKFGVRLHNRPTPLSYCSCCTGGGSPLGAVSGPQLITVEPGAPHAVRVASFFRLGLFLACVLWNPWVQERLSSQREGTLRCFAVISECEFTPSIFFLITSCSVLGVRKHIGCWSCIVNLKTG